MSKRLDRSRRDFLKKAILSGAGLTLAGGLGSAAGGEQTASSDRVPRRSLGRTGETIPILLQGGSLAFDIKYDRILHRGYQQGVDYIDTALVYADGASHRGVAVFLKQIEDRKKVWITTKGPSRNATVKSYTRDLDTCLDQLETDYADMYFMHFVDDPKYLDPEYVKMGDDLRRSKKTRFFGLSCHGDRMLEVMNRAAEAGGIDAIMFRYSFARYGDLELNKVIDRCHKAGIGLIAMKTQNSVPDDQKHVHEFKSKSFSLHQAKLKAVWADDRLAAAVSHMDNTTKLAENTAAARSPVQLSMGELQQLQRMATASASLSCQGCSHICEPLVDAPVKISSQLRYLMYDECYGEPQKARKLYGCLSEAERALENLDFSAASRACPQGIDIAGRLAVARNRLRGA